ncbi:MAG: SAF domain-containing protein [Chloroflexota bacterium]
MEVVVSLQTVPRGWQMTEAELETDMRLASTIGNDVIVKAEDVIGLYARTDIFQGQTLTRDMFVGDPTLIGSEAFGPSSLIPAGFVAQALPMDRLSGVAYGLAPGDFVDVMVSFTLTEVDEQFQSLLDNKATFYLQGEEGQLTIFTIDPFGEVETLPTNERTLITPSETKRPIPVSIILQNARVIQVGAWSPPPPVEAATPTPLPAEEEVTPTPQPDQPTMTPTPFPDVLLVAMEPQEQLLVKYALEANADIDFALRGINDGQLYTVENVDLNFILERFGIDIPANFNYTAGRDAGSGLIIPVTPTPSNQDGEGGPEGG